MIHYNKKISQIILSFLFLCNCHVLVVRMENKAYYTQTDTPVSQKYGTAIWGKFEVSKPREISCKEGIRSIVIQRTFFDFIVHYIIGGIYTIRSINATCNPHINEDITKSFVENKKLSLNSIYFDKNSAEILPESFRILDQVATVLSLKKFSSLTILGHTDITGIEEQNLILSKNRAEAVKKYLSNKGISPSKINTKGLGSSSPLFKSNDEESNRKNRRIEFLIE